jgi:protein-disulfide isomerase
VVGADLSSLSDEQKERFEKLADLLPSPCGKAHSLRTSRNNDKECLKASFAVDFVLELIKDGANDDETKELFGRRYRDMKRQGFRLSEEVPHKGPSDAPVVMVEFFDYGCPACARMKPVIDQVLKEMPTDVVLYYKQFPLASHEHSKGAAQAALAAGKQGKYHEMHDLLFENQFAHTESDLRTYAQKLGLNMPQFEKDYTTALPQVMADRKEGEMAGIEGTPSLYINGYVYEGPEHPKYMKMWISEALALNR